MIWANEFGFLPGNSGAENARALQQAVDMGGTIVVEQPGIYDIAKTVKLGSDTELVFLAGVYVRYATDENGVCSMGYMFVNKGAYSRQWDKHIAIRGMKLICGGRDVRKNTDIVGLIGHVSFYYVKHLVIDDFECMDLGKENFCIQICTFEDIRVENVHIEGNKDGVHLGRGRRFVIRNGVFRTFDDPIALNAHDYATSNPQLGWIEDGLFENCYDLDQENTTGYFCRILAGSWVDWFEGMRVQHSDTVVANGRLYRVCLDKPDGKEYVSMTCPSHEDGAQVYDGINWVMIQDDEVMYNCGCRNIHFKDIFLQKRRHTGFSIHFDHDKWSRSVYPGSQAPMQENLIFENVCVCSDVPTFFRTITPVDCVKVINSTMRNSMIAFHYLPEGTVEYPTAHVLMSGTTFKAKGEQLVVRCSKGCRGTVKILGSVAEDENFCAKILGDVRVISSDVPVKTGDII